MTLLWPEMDAESARVNLRQALCSLRHLFDDGALHSAPIIVADNQSVRLNPGSFETDVAEFESTLNIAATHKDDAAAMRLHAIELYRGEMLNGYYDEWIFTERRRLESLYLTALQEQQATLAARGEALSAVQLALRAIQLDPFNEQQYLSAMRLYALVGDPASIRRTFDEMAGILQAEMDVRPSQQTCEATKRMIIEAESARSAQTNRAATELLSIELPQAKAQVRPLWRRPLAWFATCAVIGILATFSIPRVPDVSASSATPGNQDERQIAELHSLRSHGFTTGAAEDRFATRRRHAHICVALGDKAWRSWYGHDEETWLTRFTECDEDLRASLRWLLENDPSEAVRLSGCLTRFWFVRGFQREGYRWLSESLARAPKARTPSRARALIGCAFLSSDYSSESVKKCEEALAIYRESRDPWGEAHALRHLGFLACSKAQFKISQRYYNDALNIYSRLDDARGLAVTSLCISFVSDEHNLGPRREFATRSLALFKRLGNPWGVSMAMHSLAQVETDVQKSEQLLQQAIAAYPEENGLSFKENEERAQLAALQGDTLKARVHWVRALQLARDQNSRGGVAFVFEALLNLPSSNELESARIYGATVSLDKSLGIACGHRFDRYRKRLIADLGQARFDAAVREGERISWEQAVDEASALN